VTDKVVDASAIVALLFNEFTREGIVARLRDANLDALSISPVTVDLDAAIVLAERTKLSLYDASYLWLARALGAELVTLDDSVARANEELRGAR
jgi:predicted nucleic acid-binding protein